VDQLIGPSGPPWPKNTSSLTFKQLAQHNLEIMAGRNHGAGWGWGITSARQRLP
jgi:hypothetical protein